MAKKQTFAKTFADLPVSRARKRPVQEKACIADVHNAYGVGFHKCLNTSLYGKLHCGVHDPERQAARNKAATKCAYVHETTGKPDCIVRVQGTKYCAWHAGYVLRNRTYVQAQAQRATERWLSRLLEARKCTAAVATVKIVDVLKRLRARFRNI